MRQPIMPILRTLACTLLILQAGRAGAAEGSLNLQPGDVISITVAGYPELNQRAPVQIGGWLSSNLLGQVETTGLDLPALQTRMREQLGSRPYERSGANGRTTFTRISPDALTLDMAAYRPFYITGDVARPGEQTFRPGILVRQAISLAGGLDAIRGRMTESERLRDTSDVRAEIVALNAQLAAKRADVQRLQALLGQAPVSTPPAGTASESGLGQALKTSSAHQTSLAAENERRLRAYQAATVQQAEEHLKVLRERYQREVEGAEADYADYARIRDLFRAGTVANTRVSDARRAWQMASGQSLQTLARINDVERERDKAAQELATLASQRQITLEESLRVALVDQASVEARLAAAHDKLALLGAVRPGTRPGIDMTRVMLRIRRMAADDTQTIAASETTELMPGDVLEVSLVGDDTNALSAR